MSEIGNRPDDWATHFWAGEQDEAGTLDKAEQHDSFDATGQVPISPASRPNRPAVPHQLRGSTLAPQAELPAGNATRSQRQTAKEPPLSQDKQPGALRRLTSGRGALIIGVGLGLNLAALTALIVMRDDEPQIFAAAVDDSDELADEDSLRIEVPLTPEPPVAEQPNSEVETNQSLTPLQIVITDGNVILRGTASSDQQAQDMATEAAELFAGVPLVKEYIVNPAAPTPERGVAIQKPVAFEPGSSVIRDEFKPLLDACADLMKQNPTLVMNVNGHTDSDGPGEYNLELAKSRTQAVIDYYRSQGLDTSKLAIDPPGEEAGS